MVARKSSSSAARASPSACTTCRRASRTKHSANSAPSSWKRASGWGYEQKAVPWAVNGTRWDFGHELLNDDLERVAEPLEARPKGEVKDELRVDPVGTRLAELLGSPVLKLDESVGEYRTQCST